MKKFDPAKLDLFNTVDIVWALRCRFCYATVFQLREYDHKLVAYADCVECNGKGVPPIPLEELL